jgi:glutathione S-transferase
MTERADLVIYGMKNSPFVCKVQVLLAEINPAKRIPVLRDHSVGAEGVVGTIPDSPAICAYLECKHPEPALYLKDAFAYGRALWLEEYADIAVATQFVNLRLAGGSVDTARWPKLAAYALRIHARPSFAACIEDESRSFPPDSYEL